MYALPSPRPDTAAFNRAAFVGPIRTVWEPVKLALGLTPSPAWDFKAEYTRIGKSGERPMGQAFGGPGGNASEILEPIDQTMHDLKLSQSYARPSFQVAATYDVSLFRNSIGSVTSDNPLQTSDTPTTGAARGRTALAPDNVAHTVVVTGGVELPARTRVTANAAVSWWRQDAAFIPSTSNSAIVDARLAQVPTSLGGSARTANLAASVTTRPLSWLTFSGRYRSYAFRDGADISAIPIIIVNDRSIDPADTARRNPFTRRTADLSGSWQLLGPLALSVGYAWEQMERDPLERQVLRTNERTPRITLDFTGFEWFGLRASYSKGWRRGTGYDAGDENPDSRRFDEADRDRERTNLIALDHSRRAGHAHRHVAGWPRSLPRVALRRAERSQLRRGRRRRLLAEQLAHGGIRRDARDLRRSHARALPGGHAARQPDVRLGRRQQRRLDDHLR